VLILRSPRCCDADNSAKPLIVRLGRAEKDEAKPEDRHDYNKFNSFGGKWVVMHHLLRFAVNEYAYDSLFPD